MSILTTVVACAGGTRPSAVVDLIASIVELGENSMVWDEPHRDLEWIVERRTAI
jgi:hypothetical protein